MTELGTRVPTEILKLTLVVSLMLVSERMAEVIWVRFSAGGAAVAEVAALPVVGARPTWCPLLVPDLTSVLVPDLVSAAVPLDMAVRW